MLSADPLDTDYSPSGIILYTEDGGTTYKGKDSSNTYVGMDQKDNDDGTYDYTETFSVSTTRSHTDRERDGLLRSAE